MNTGISKSPGSKHWRELYKVAQAEKAVVLRARELFQEAGDNGRETEALDDVMYALHALGSNPQMRSSPNHGGTP
jgi:hypothetical protein